MPDLEKVIRELENIGAWHTHHYNQFHYECAETIHNAIALLKKQEAKEQCLKTKCIICPHCDNCDVDENGLLKEHDKKKKYRIPFSPDSNVQWTT